MCWSYGPVSFRSILSQNVINNFYIFPRIHSLTLLQKYVPKHNCDETQNAPDFISVLWNHWHAFAEPHVSEELSLKNIALHASFSDILRCLSEGMFVYLFYFRLPSVTCIQDIWKENTLQNFSRNIITRKWVLQLLRNLTPILIMYNVGLSNYRIPGM
jgi:hypothetical protein